jgi:DNA-directed RNA polymerase sigma subunit (sigma70/sigma32)
MKLTCPKCYEDFTFLKILKLWLWLKLPYGVQTYLEARKEARDLADLKRLYRENSDLTHREHYVCEEIKRGLSFEDVADNMIVSRERVRQIFYKALRKLKKQENET